MNYDMNMIKYRKSGFFRIAAAILMICFTLFGLTACAGTTDSKDNNDDNALIQGTWEYEYYVSVSLWSCGCGACRGVYKNMS